MNNVSRESADASDNGAVIDESRSVCEPDIGAMLDKMWPEAGTLSRLSLDSEQLDRMLDKHTDKISEITLAMNLVWNRVAARSRA